MPTLLAAPSATVELPSAEVAALVTAFDEMLSAPGVVTAPPLATKALVSLLTVPTATAPARSTLPSLVEASLSVSAFFESVSSAVPLSVAPLGVDLASAVSVFWASASSPMDAAPTTALPPTDASVRLACVVPMTATPSVAPAPPAEPSANAAASVRLAAERLNAPATLSWALPPTRAMASLVTSTLATAASVFASVLPASDDRLALAATAEPALTSSSPVAVTWALPAMSTCASDEA